MSNSVSRSNAPFDLLHLDVWGSFNPATINGHKFFLTIVDDYSRFTWVYLLQSKSDVRDVFITFYNQVSTHFQNSIQVVRSDNAPELNLKDFFKAHEIIAHKSYVETPQQNA